MTIFLTDHQQTEIERSLAQAGSVLAVVNAWHEKFRELGWSTPEYAMFFSKRELTNALCSIAKTMQDASGVADVERVNETMGERR